MLSLRCGSRQVVVALETTTDATWHHRHQFWNFDRLVDALAASLCRVGIAVERVGARRTSSHCPACNSAQVVRRPRHVLSCRACRFRIHSDQAGSRNTMCHKYPHRR